MITAQRQPGKFASKARLVRCLARAADPCAGCLLQAAQCEPKIHFRRAPQTRQRLVKGETLVREMRRTQRRSVRRSPCWQLRLQPCAVLREKSPVTQPDVWRQQFVISPVATRDMGMDSDARDAWAHHRDFGNLPKLSRVNNGNYYRSNPVRVQSDTAAGCSSTPRPASSSISRCSMTPVISNFGARFGSYCAINFKVAQHRIEPEQKGLRDRISQIWYLEPKWLR